MGMTRNGGAAFTGLNPLYLVDGSNENNKVYAFIPDAYTALKPYLERAQAGRGDVQWHALFSQGACLRVCALHVSSPRMAD